MNVREFAWRLVTVVAAVLASIAPSRAADTTQVRAVPDFDHIRMQGAFRTDISVGAHRTHVTLTGDQNVLDRVTTEVQDGWLVVGMRPGGRIGSFPQIHIAVAHLRAFENNGAGTATINGLNGGDIAITNAGAATITAYGHAAQEAIALNGTGVIDATAVTAHNVTVDNNGVGSVRVRTNGALVMNVNGVGDIRYAGNPSHVESHVNGIGRISRI